VDRARLRELPVIDRFHQFCKCAARTAHLMVGIPDYNAYREHRQTTHPQELVMTYEEFYRETQRRRYAPEKGKFSCC
jgi:uncharacterized short protein YbdD (DUF466 family)